MSQKPPVRRTWAPKGCTPVLEHPFSWQNLSAATFLCYRWDNRRHDMCFQIKPGSYNTSSLAGALGAFHKHMGRRRVLLVWDGLSAHRSKAMKAWLSRRGGWIHVERLAAYAPELNPVEQVWRNVKGCELANLCVFEMKQTHAALRAGLSRVAGSSLAKSFLKHAGLKL